MLNLIPEAIIGLVLAAYLGYYGLFVMVESLTGRKPESFQVTEDVQLGSLE
jgi:hypothetical protein